jgi:high affinity sulfate transporter 1
MSIAGLSRFIPILDWLPHYPRGGLRADVIAGLTTAAVVVPKALAYAAIAGLPIEAGLYTAAIPAVIYAVFGTSRPLSVSTTTTIAILTATELAVAVPDGSPAQLMAASATLAALVGLTLVLAAILRLGFIANFISDPVLSGFKAGVGLVIVTDQLPKMLGIHLPDEGFFRKLAAIPLHLADASIPTLVLALVVLLLALGLERFAPRAPAPLLALATGVAASGLLGLQGMGVALVGHVPAGLPSPALPNLSLAWQLWPGAAGIALMGFVETIAAGRSFAGKGDPRPDPNQELLALGVAGVVGSLFRSMPTGGGTSQTAVNRKAGARTQLAALVTAAIAIATMLFLSPVIDLMPQAALAAVVVVASVGLLDPADLNSIRRVRADEFWWAVVALGGVLLLGTLEGIVVAVIVSLLTLMYQANHQPVYALGRKPGTNVFRPLSSRHPKDEALPGLLMLRTEGRVYFANAQRIGDKMWPMIREAKPQVLVLDCSAVPDIEYTALKMLTEAEEKLREAGITLWLAALNPTVLEIINRSKLGKILTRERLFSNLELAAEAYRADHKQTEPGTTAAEPRPLRPRGESL